MSTPQDIAQWMFDSVKNSSAVYQEEIMYDIESKFGPEWVYETEYGNLAINKDILKEFTKITKDVVVYEKYDKCWRMRTVHDSPGRQQG
jgi:hypothetical protein